MGSWLRSLGAAGSCSTIAAVPDSFAADLCLCWGTCEGAPFDELVAAAAEAGCSSVAVTPAMYFAERAAGRSGASLRERLDASGIDVAMLDPLIRGLPGALDPSEIGPRFRSTFEHDENDCYEAAAALGARAINIAHYLGRPTPPADLAAAIRGVATRAADRGLGIYVEFMPEGAIPDLSVALEIVERVALPSVGILFDTWHFFRSGGTVEQVEALPDHAVHGVQVSDAPAELFGTGLTPPSPDRIAPGLGAIPLVPILRALARKHPPLVVALEVFNRATRRDPAAERARNAADAYRRLAGPDRHK